MYTYGATLVVHEAIVYAVRLPELSDRCRI